MGKRKTARARAWTAMRVLRHFTHKDIMEISGISKSNLGSFLNLLEKSGYLRKKNGIFVLLRDSGAKTPVSVDDKMKYKVFDVNLGVYFEGLKPKRILKYANNKLCEKNLAKAVRERGLKSVSEILDYSRSTIVAVLANKYPADKKRIYKRIKERL